MKRIFLILFTALLATQAWSETTFEVGNLKYTVIEGTTNVSVSKGSTAPTDALDILEKVTNPNNEQEYTVTSIGEWAFEDCSGLTSVTIPNSVTSIGSYAFDYCSGLTTVTIPNSVTSIGNYAFGDCSGLRSVTIPNSVTSIGEWAFSYCSGLTSVTIPNSVTSIGGWAFTYCNSLEKAEFASIESLCGIDFGNWAANPLCKANHLYITGEENEVTELTIPSSVTSIGDYAFTDCSGLTSVTIPNTVTSIGEQAFYNCSGLTSVTIPNSVTSIGSSAFRGCSGLTSVTIPNSVTSIGKEAFFTNATTTIYCETALPKPEGWNETWNRGSYEDLIVPAIWGCQVIRGAANDESFGSVTANDDDAAVKAADGSLWYLADATNISATLIATPAEGYHFVQWEDDTEAGATRVVSTIQSQSYKAIFESDASTSIKHNNADKTKTVRKVLGPDGLYIIKDGVKYNALGVKVEN